MGTQGVGHGPTPTLRCLQSPKFWSLATASPRRVWFRVWGLGLGGWGFRRLGLKLQGFQGLGFRVEGSGSRGG